MNEMENNAAAALRLRQAGVSYEVIADKLGYASAEAAKVAVDGLLAQKVRDMDAVAAHLEIEQLDSLRMSFWSEAKGGDKRAAEIVLRIHDRKRELKEDLKGLPFAKPTRDSPEGAEGGGRPDGKRRGDWNPAFGGGTNVPGSTQQGDELTEETKRKMSLAMRGNMNAWKTGAGSRFVPSLYCNNCPVVATCQHYTQDSVCLVPEAFRSLSEEFGDGTPETIISVLKRMVADNLERLEIGRAAEYAAGGKLAREVTALSSRIEKQLKLLMALYGRYDVVGGRRIVNVTQQNLIVGGEVAQTTMALLKLPQAKRLEFLESWQGSLQTQREILEESGIDVSGLRGFGGVASAGNVLARIGAMTAPPGVDGEAPGEVEGRGASEVIDAEWSEVDGG
jgi:hypothetical protein